MGEQKRKCPEIIKCRIRAKKDDDLRRAIEQLSEGIDISDVLRDALRAWFFEGERVRTVVSDEQTPMPMLDRIEKSDDELTGGLDDLLNNF
jgi:hypothetical protein